MDKRFPLPDQIEMLATALRGRVAMPHHADYDDLRAASLSNFDHRPAAVIRVANAADIAAVLNFARATDLEVAVRSGGHSVGGHSGSEGGLVIDLRDLKDLRLDPAAMTLWAGAGLTAGEVTTAVEHEGFIVGFGDSANVGISGLTLGGGIGYMVRKHGLTIDTLLAAELVTAEGDIIVADEQHHAELFWALRGGGGNFGVVTRLKYRLHPLPEFVGGPLFLPATPEVMVDFVRAAEAAPDELSAIAMVVPAPPLPFLPPEIHGKPVFLAMMAYAGGMAAAAPVLAPFRALATPVADLVRPAPYSSLYIFDEPGVRPAVSVRSRFTETLSLAQARSMIDSVVLNAAPMRMAQVRVLGGALARVPAGATAFAHRQSRLMISFLSLYGGDAEVVAAQDAWAEESMAGLGLGEVGGTYVNFLSDGSETQIRAAYPAGTWERLARVKRRYDPENLFRRNHNIPPAV